MKPVSKIRRKFLWAATVLCAVVVANISYAQNTADSSSAIVSPKSGGDADVTIETRKPSVSDDADDLSIAVDPASLLPELPPFPRANATLVGGILERLDQVRDRAVIRVFGGGSQTVLFDPRTNVYQDGKAATVADLREGQRVYLDTILDGSTVFARTIRLGKPHAMGETQGVVVTYRIDRAELTYRDSLSPDVVRVLVTPGTKVKQGDQQATVSQLVPGTLISVGYSSDGTGKNSAREILILALPNTRYTFAGQVVHIDLRSGLLVLSSSTDHKTYEVYLAPSAAPEDNLQVGANVTAVTEFDGTRYVARTLTISPR